MIENYKNKVQQKIADECISFLPTIVDVIEKINTLENTFIKIQCDEWNEEISFYVCENENILEVGDSFEFHFHLNDIGDIIIDRFDCFSETFLILQDGKYKSNFSTFDYNISNAIYYLTCLNDEIKTFNKYYKNNDFVTLNYLNTIECECRDFISNNFLSLMYEFNDCMVIIDNIIDNEKDYKFYEVDVEFEYSSKEFNERLNRYENKKKYESIGFSVHYDEEVVICASKLELEFWFGYENDKIFVGETNWSGGKIIKINNDGKREFTFKGIHDSNEALYMLNGFYYLVNGFKKAHENDDLIIKCHHYTDTLYEGWLEEQKEARKLFWSQI